MVSQQVNPWRFDNARNMSLSLVQLFRHFHRLYNLIKSLQQVGG